jgi:antitoxin component YwqK of YwqJK toxin-antitoxin module
MIKAMKIFCLILCISSSANIKAQIFKIDFGDTIYYKEKRRGSSRIFHLSLKETLADGTYWVYLDQIKIQEINYKSGMRNGISQYLENGKVRSKRNFRADTLIEFWDYPIAGKKEICYLNEKYSWDQNYRIIDFRILDRKNKNWALEGRFKNSIKDGSWKLYDKKGKLRELVIFKNGELDSSKEGLELLRKLFGDSPYFDANFNKNYLKD